MQDCADPAGRRRSRKVSASSTARNQVGDVRVKFGESLVKRGDARGVRTSKVREVGIGHLAVADDPGDRDVVVRGIIRPELVPRTGGDLLEYRSGRLGSLTLADQQPHKAALGDGAGGETSAGSDEPCLGLTVVNVLFNDERDQDVGVEQDGGHLIVLERADVIGGDYPAQPYDGQSGRGAVRQRCRLALA
jgi:hypothetical protein